MVLWQDRIGFYFFCTPWHFQVAGLLSFQYAIYTGEKKSTESLLLCCSLSHEFSSWSAFYFLLSTSQSFLIVTLPASWEICMQVKKQQLEPDMEQQTGSK